MDVKIENLIEKIRQEGVEEGKKASDQIIVKAKKEADGLVKKAKEKAKKLSEDAEKEASQFQQSAEMAIGQAARDAELILKQKITGLFDDVFKKQVSDVMDADFMKQLILNIVSQWADKPGVEISVNEKDKLQLEKSLLSGLTESAKDTIIIRTSPDINKGFRISIKDQDIYYDFSEDTIADMLKQFVNPRLAEILERENG